MQIPYNQSHFRTSSQSVKQFSHSSRHAQVQSLKSHVDAALPGCTRMAVASTRLKARSAHRRFIIVLPSCVRARRAGPCSVPAARPSRRSLRPLLPRSTPYLASCVNAVSKAGRRRRGVRDATDPARVECGDSREAWPFPSRRSPQRRMRERTSHRLRRLRMRDPAVDPPGRFGTLGRAEARDHV